jgi:predicted nucleotide-binding protein (sugar kinase/HSP70/actin superfamily)
MLNLRVFRILDYYDFPQLLHCKDRYDSNYISVLAEVSENYLYYIATKITNNSIDELYKNICDVSSLFSVDNPFFDFKLHNETEEWFSINETSYEHIKSYIPEEGLFIDYEIEEDFISKKALEINKTIFELHLAEGPSNSVATNTLVDFLTYTQKIFDYSYSAVSKKLSSKIKKRIKENNSSQMNVFSFQPGSLKVNFVTNAFVDMLGNSDDELLIDKLREIFEVHGMPKILFLY